MEKLLSVLITTYNLEKYIENTLDSVFAQNFPFEMEVIVGDDGSSDGTVNKIRNYSQKHNVRISIAKMHREENKKYNPIYRASHNRLNLLRHASGKYITFLDGDDFYIDNNFFANACAVLEANPDLSLCGGYLRYYFESTNTYKDVRISGCSEGVISKSKYWVNSWIHAECFIFRNTYIKEKNIYMNSKVFDDNLLTFYYMKYGKMYYLDRAVAAYRQNMTPWKKKNRYEKAFLNAIDYFEETNINPKYIIFSLLRHSGDFAYILLHENDMSTKKTFFLNSCYSKECKKVLDLISIKTPGCTAAKMIIGYFFACLSMIKRFIRKLGEK